MHKIICFFIGCLTSCLLLLPIAHAVDEVRKPYSVNINTASAQMLSEALDGVGAAKAQAIVAYRKQHGAFSSVDGLASVSGIGAATVESNKKRIRLK
jgi:competence protein ComEA